MLPESLPVFLLRLLVSPALPGALFLLLGSLISRHPPKKLNIYYGYRTRRSMLNQDTWTEGNQYSTALIIRLAKPCLLLGIACSLLVPLPVLLFVSAGAVLAIVSLVLILTEKRLGMLFDRDGNRR